MARGALVLGGGVLAAYLYARGKRRDASAAPLELTGRWIWPLAPLKGRAPVISDGFGSPRPGGIRHAGVDLMYRRTASDVLVAGTPNATNAFVMPDGTQALAASEGIVRSAKQSPRGFAVVIDHGPVATFYTHLEKLLVEPKQRVHAGDLIGIVGFDPLDPAKLKHLHFEVWRDSSAIDPAPLMRDWRVVHDLGGPLVARNAGFTFRPVGSRGEPYPQWVRNLKDASGVYLIRERGGELVYVGSSQGRLYDTLTRHFQTVRHEAQEVPMT